MKTDTKVAVIGLGYVGLPLAVEFGKKYPVVGFDLKPARIAELREGRDSTEETTPDELAAAKHLSFTCDPADLKGCQVFIVCVPTPVDEFNLTFRCWWRPAARRGRRCRPAATWFLNPPFIPARRRKSACRKSKRRPA